MGYKERLVQSLIACAIAMIALIFMAVAVGLGIATLYLALEDVMAAWQAMGLTALAVLLVALVLLLVARGMGGSRKRRSATPRERPAAEAEPQAEQIRGARSTSDLAARLVSRWSGGGHAREGVISLFALGLLLGSMPEVRELVFKRKRKAPPPPP